MTICQSAPLVQPHSAYPQPKMVCRYLNSGIHRQNCSRLIGREFIVWEFPRIPNWNKGQAIRRTLDYKLLQAFSLQRYPAIIIPITQSPKQRTLAVRITLSKPGLMAPGERTAEIAAAGPDEFIWPHDPICWGRAPVYEVCTSNQEYETD